VTNTASNIDVNNKLAHACAWLLACATFPLIWVGGLVTTTGAGMAFPDWMNSDGTFFLFYDWLSSVGDKFVEHGHRLLGATAGFLSIALVIVVWRTESRGWVRKFSWVILAGVIMQGVLGGIRVLLDERVLAMIHGCTGPLFFLLCVTMVIVTSRWWQTCQPLVEKAPAKNAFRLAIVCTVLAYLQLIVGAAVRHSPHMIGEAAAVVFRLAVYFHVFLALVIVAHVLLLAWRCLRIRVQRVGGIGLLILVAAQLCLGVGTWIVKYGIPPWATSLLGEMTFANRAEDAMSAQLITGHVAIGSLILAVSLAIALRLARQLDIRWVGLPLASFCVVGAER